MKAKITVDFVKGLEVGPTDFTIFDKDLKGFGVRVRKTGAKSYIVEYKADHGRGAPTRRFTIGKVGAMAPDQARKRAKEILGEVALGKDPASDKTSERRAAKLSDAMDAYLSECVEKKRKPSTAAWMRDAINRILKPALGATKVDQVTKQAVSRLHSSMSDRPIQANRTLAILSAFYTWAGRDGGFVAEGFNPARGVEKFEEVGRERFLTADELARLGEALRLGETVGLPYEIDETKPGANHAAKEASRFTKVDPYAVAAIRLLILTGARLREILHARWTFVDFDRGVIFLPTSKTGKKPIYLSAAALEVLAVIPRVEGNPYLFPGHKAGASGDDAKASGRKEDAPRADLKKPWAAITKAAALPGLRIHDLRHSFASVGAGASMGLPIIGKLLGHKQSATTERYAHLDADPMKRAANAIGATIAAAMSREPQSGPPSNVVSITSRRA